MKTLALASWKWILVGGALLCVGLMMAAGLGRRRGTRAYRWRVSLWAFALVLLGGSALAVTGCDSAGKDKAEVATPDATTADKTAEPDYGVMCYAPRLPDGFSEEGRSGPDVQVLCYVMDVEPAPDVLCYAPLPPDIQEDLPATKDAGDEPDVMIMCYDPMIEDVVPVPEEIHEDQDLPMPTCYAPPFPEE
jgi:hypothetical protein